MDEDNDGEREDRDGETDDRVLEYERDYTALLEVGENVEIGGSEGNDLPEYTFTPGCTVSVEGNTPLSYFSLLFTTNILQHIVDQTNIYANQFIATHDLGPHSRARRWTKRSHDLSAPLHCNDHCHGYCPLSSNRESLVNTLALF